jgi:hypothetical protein
MAAISARRRALGMSVAVLVVVALSFELLTAAASAAPAPPVTPTTAPLPALPAAPHTPAGETPFPMPMDTGPKMLLQSSTARKALATLGPQLKAAQRAKVDRKRDWDRLTAELVRLDDDRAETVAQLVAAKQRLGASAATAYMQSGGGRLNAALQSVQSAQTVLDLSRDMHLINTYGEHEITVVEALQEQKDALDKEIRTVSRRRVRVKRDLAAAVAKFNDLHAQALAQRKLYDEAQFQLAEFKELATTAGSPIMGPSRLTAADLAAYLRRNGYHPNITVPIEQLAQFYIEEGAKVGVRGDVAFAQSILETGGFNFAHSMVEVPDNNYAGIGACDSCHRGFIFPDARTGVRAQVQLLRVYVDRTVTADSFPDPLLLPRT